MGIETEVSENASSVEVCVMITNGTVEDGSAYVRYSTLSGSATGIINYVWLHNEHVLVPFT